MSSQWFGWGTDKKIIEVRNQPVQGRKGRQYGWLRHHSSGFLPSQFFHFRQVAEGTRNRADVTRVILEPWLIRSKIMEANLWLLPLSLGRLGFWGSNRSGTPSHKYKKSLSPLGKVPHSFIRVFLYLVPTLSFHFCSCNFNWCFQALCLASSLMGGFPSCTTCQSRSRVHWTKC
jgi:hypothetical protein